MGNSILRSDLLFRPLLTAGIVIVSFGIVCIWVGSSIDLKEEGEGFMIIKQVKRLFQEKVNLQTR